MQRCESAPRSEFLRRVQFARMLPFVVAFVKYLGKSSVHAPKVCGREVYNYREREREPSSTCILFIILFSRADTWLNFAAAPCGYTFVKLHLQNMTYGLSLMLALAWLIYFDI